MYRVVSIFFLAELVHLAELEEIEKTAALLEARFTIYDLPFTIYDLRFMISPFIDYFVHDGEYFFLGICAEEGYACLFEIRKSFENR